VETSGFLFPLTSDRSLLSSATMYLWNWIRVSLVQYLIINKSTSRWEVVVGLILILGLSLRGASLMVVDCIVLAVRWDY